MVELPDIDEPVDLKLNAESRCGEESVPAVLILSQFPRLNLSVTKLGGGEELASVQRHVAHYHRIRKI